MPTIAMLLFLGLLHASASEPEVAVLGLHVEGLSEEEGYALCADLTEALDSTGDVTPIPPERVAGRLEGRESLVLAEFYLGPGRKRLEEGRVLYERAAPDQAIPLLEDAVRSLSRGMAGAGDPQDLVEALLLLGLSHFSMGEEAEAKRAFGRVVVLDPGFALDPVNYPPRMVEFFGKTRDSTLVRGSGSISVQSEEPGAEVWIDGRLQGVTPIEVKDLPHGDHFLLVKDDEGRRFFKEVPVRVGHTATLEPPLHQRTITQPASTESERAHQVRSLFRALGEHIDTDLVLVGGTLSGDRVGIQLYATRSENFSRPIVFSLQGDSPSSAALDLVPSLTAFITDTGSLRSDRVSPEVLPLDVSANPVLGSLLLDPDPDVQVITEKVGPRWYVWTGAAVLAAGGTATAVWAVAGEHDRGTVIVGPMP